MEASTPDLMGRRILVVEDESMVSMLIEDTLADMGCVVVALASRFDDGLSKAQTLAFDIAILDVNLKGENVWPVATRLRQEGVPFVIASGGHVDPPPAEFASVPLIEKPYTVDRVTPAIDAACAG